MHLIDADKLRERLDGSNEVFTAGFVRALLKSAPTIGCETCWYDEHENETCRWCGAPTLYEPKEKP